MIYNVPINDITIYDEVMGAMGEREAMGVNTSGEDIWRGNELTTAGSGSLPADNAKIPIPSDSGELMTIVSESDADNGAGATGALRRFG